MNQVSDPHFGSLHLLCSFPGWVLADPEGARRKGDCPLPSSTTPQLSGKFKTGARTAKSQLSPGSPKRALHFITKCVVKIGCSRLAVSLLIFQKLSEFLTATSLL